jgi:hypothetical protein
MLVPGAYRDAALHQMVDDESQRLLAEAFPPLDAAAANSPAA